MTGKGDGTFNTATIVKTGAGTFISDVAIADLNGDGKPDIVATDTVGNARVFMGDGLGAFPTSSTYASAGAPSGVAIGDVNGDSKHDSVISDTNGTVSVLAGKGDGTFDAQVSFSVGKTSQNVALGDLNGNGTLDIVTAKSDA